jgi:hypothetical protein
MTSLNLIFCTSEYLVMMQRLMSGEDQGEWTMQTMNWVLSRSILSVEVLHADLCRVLPCPIYRKVGRYDQGVQMKTTVQ